MKRAALVGLAIAATGAAVLLLRRPAPPPPAPATAARAPAPAPPSAPDLAAVRREVEGTVAGQPRSFQIRMQAAEFYMRAGLPEAAVPHLEAAVRLSPKALLAWTVLGDAGTLSDRYPLAERAYARAAALAPDDPLVTRGRGQLLIRRGRLVEARRVLEAGLERHPQEPEISTALAGLYLLLNRPRRAIDLIRPILKQDPERPDLHTLLANAHEKDLHLEAAAAELREVIRLNPSDDQAWGRLGLYAIKLGRKVEAREPLQRAIALNPREPHYLWALAASYDPVPSVPASFETPVSLTRTALKLGPRNLETLSSLASLLMQRGGPGDLEEAAELLRRSLAIRPEDASLHYKLSQVYRRLGLAAEAEAEAARFESLFRRQDRADRKLQRVRSFEDTAAAHVQRGRDLLAEKEYGAAAAEFRLALDRDPGAAGARAGLEEAEARSRPATGGAGSPMAP